jgi:electron transport complex protein RnfE
MKKENNLSVLLKGILRENPVFVLVLGTCPTLATTTTVTGALGMGLATLAVLVCSNIVISALRKFIPDTVRIPCYIVLIAGFVTAVELLMHAFVPSLYNSLGIFLSLIVVNCIILGRAEMYASKNRVLDSAVDAIGMGIGFIVALFAMAFVREVFGAGSFCGINIQQGGNGNNPAGAPEEYAATPPPDDSLSGGAIAGIVAGSVVGVALIIVAVLFFLKRRRDVDLSA